jgi:hypothetical protein
MVASFLAGMKMETAGSDSFTLNHPVLQPQDEEGGD